MEMIILNSLEKVKYFILIAVIIIFPKMQTVYGDDEMETKPHMPAISEKAVADRKAPSINALAAVVMESSSGRVLYSKNATARRSMASTTKIMTAVVALEKGSLEDEVTISKRAAGVGGSTLGLQTGQKYTLKELLYAMLMISANDAAVAIAEHI
jgi:D-alanyl-D-alanine carboxypeptidase (penicillin-binding protein 5/6)